MRIKKVVCFAFISYLSWAAESPALSRAHMVVTSGRSYSHEPPLLTKDDLSITQGYEPLPIISVIPLRGERAGLE